MDKLAFGLTMMIVGIGGTFLTLGILIWSIELLKKLFPLEPSQAGMAGPLISLERLPPQWRAKIPVEKVRLRWNQQLASMQHAHRTWQQSLPAKRISAHWSSVHGRIFGRGAGGVAPPTHKAPAKTHHDQTRPL
jgi:hypothetical protein